MFPGHALATGGLYLAGGVAVHALPLLQKPAFLDRFKRKGRFADLVGRIPLNVITTPVGLMGAAAQGLETAAPGVEYLAGLHH